MIKVECSIDETINVDDLLGQIGIDKQMSLLSFAANTAYKMMDNFVPKSNGYLTKNGFIQGGRLREDHMIYPENSHYIIEYTQPYSRYQYYGVRADGSHRVKNYTTPGTGPYWDKAMITAKGDEFTKQLERYIERKLK